MSLAFRRSLVVVAVLISGVIVSGCAESPEATAGTAGTSGSSGPAFLDIQVNDSSVTVSNKAGQPLLDLALTLRPSRGSSVYQLEFRRFESTERREIPFAEFKTGGGLPFRGGTPSSISATAVDFVGAKREMMFTP
jgi:hypothetical protein